MEPYSAFGKPISLPTDTKAYYKQGEVRTAIVFDRQVAITELTQFQHRDRIAAVVRVGDRKILIASVYCDILHNINDTLQTLLQPLLTFATCKGMELLLACDTNAHSELFGPDNNARGDILEEALSRWGLKVENCSETPTFRANRGTVWAESHIDVTLTKGLVTPVLDWCVDDSYNGSDHSTITFSLETTPLSSPPKPSWKRMKWDVFQVILVCLRM